MDKSLRLPAYWADCEVGVCKDIKAAREVWDTVLKNKTYASLPVRHLLPHQTPQPHARLAEVPQRSADREGERVK